MIFSFSKSVISSPHDLMFKKSLPDSLPEGITIPQRKPKKTLLDVLMAKTFGKNKVQKIYNSKKYKYINMYRISTLIKAKELK